MKQKNFFIVANIIFELGLKPKEIAVYCCLLRHADKDNTCFPSRRKIGSECGVDTKTVDKALKNLTEQGLIQIQNNRYRKDGTLTSNKYFVTDLVEKQQIETG